MTRLTVMVKATLMAVIGAAALWTVSAVPRASGPTINLNPFGLAIDFNNPIGIDFFEPAPVVAPGSGSLLATANYENGLPNNFQLINALGVHTPFTSLAGLANEIKVATVRDGGCSTSGFVVGTAFAGNGVAGQILKINPDGTFLNPWVTLPGETAHIRGSLYQDRTCVFGGDLIVVTGNEQNGDPLNDNVGNVWRVTSAGVPTKLATINRHLEGVITVPDDAAKYGVLAATIIVGDEDLHMSAGGQEDTYPLPDGGRLWVITPGGGVFTVGAAAPPFVNFPTNLPLHIEDIDLIPQPRPGFASPEGDLFAVDFGHGQILRAPASDFADKCGQILLTQEFPMGSTPTLPSGFSTLTWDPNQQKFVVTPLQNTGTADVGHYEHVTFWGGTECTPTPKPGVTIVKFTNGADANDPNAAGVPNIPSGGTVTWTYRVTNTGQTSVPQAQVVVTDNTTGVTPTFTSEVSGNGDAIFDPGEVWLYTATGVALDLTLPAPAGVNTVANSCTAGGTVPPSTAYTNIGTVTIPGASATDPSSYCNPPGTNKSTLVAIIKYTNGADANDPNAAGVPNIVPGGAVTWTYKVTNIGQTSVPKADVHVTDNTTGVTPTFTSVLTGNADTIFEPGEVWLYTATGTALDLTLPAPVGVVTVANKCTAGGAQPPRTAYINLGRVDIPGASAVDPSSYCNPPPSSKSISIGPSSMEGAIKISSGDWVNGGYSFKTNFTGNITISATVSLTGKCIGGSLLSDTMTFSLGSVQYAAVAGADWKPTGDANSILSWEGSTVAPASLCGGGQLDASKGAVYNATISGAPTGGLVTFRFKYRDPASKGKPNTNCLNASDPNRAKADVCGASWSATKVDP